MERRLYRSRSDRLIAGVAGGLGEYLGLDPVIIRILFVILAFAGGPGVLLYIILWLVVPVEPLGEWRPAGDESLAKGSYRRLDSRERTMLVGGALIALGLLFLGRELHLFWWWVNLWRLWPLVLVAAGVALLIDQTRSAR